MIINYIAANKLIYIVDSIFIIPMADFSFLPVYLFMTGIFLTLTIYNYLKYGDRDNT